MKLKLRDPRSAIVLLIFLAGPAGWAEALGTLVPVEVRADREQALVAKLEAAGVTAIGWSNAQVEISDFHGVQTVSLFDLKERLTPGDPRWDPWLGSLPGLFHPKSDTSRIWVSSVDRSKALGTLGGDAVGTSAPGQSPLSVIGWGGLAFALLYSILKLVSVCASGPSFRRGLKSWRWVPLSLALVAGGAYLGTGGGAGVPVPKEIAGEPTWTQHRWFQESLPYGASWKDWVPGKRWSYPSYEVKEGRLTEVPVLLKAPDGPWSKEAFSGLDPHHAARIFGFENP